MTPLLVGEIVYTVPLAMVDFVPVILAGTAWFVVARAISPAGSRLRAVTIVGAMLIALGGLCKAGWKLVIASSATDLTGVDDLLFPFLATGFTILAATLVARKVWEPIWVDSDIAVRRVERVALPVVVTIAVGVRVMMASSPFEDAVGILLPIVVVTSLVTIAALIRWARASQDTTSFVALLAHLILTLGLGYLGTLDEQTIALQWIEELSNVANQGALLFAALRLAAPYGAVSA